MLEVIDTEYLNRADRTADILSNGMVIYNHEGIHCRLFKNKEDFEKWIDTGDENLVIADSDEDNLFELVEKQYKGGINE